MSTKSSQSSKKQLRSERINRGRTSLCDENKIIVRQPLGLTVVSAIDSLMNCRITKSETDGKITTVSYTYPPELIKVFRGLFGGSNSYRFMIHSSSPQAADVAGAIKGAYSWNPATATYAEWSALSALFDEVAMISSELTWTANVVPTSTTIPAQISIAPDFVNDGTAPTGFTAVNRLAGSQEFGYLANLNSNGSSTIKFHVRTVNRLYASTATPSSATPPAGCRGQWSWASSNAVNASVIYAQTTIRNIVNLRCRA